MIGVTPQQSSRASAVWRGKLLAAETTHHRAMSEDVWARLLVPSAAQFRLSSFRKFLEPHVDRLRPKVGHRETDRKFETAWPDATRIDIQYFILGTDERLM
jgi:hypothetical protein